MSTSSEPPHVPRVSRVINVPKSWHNPTGDLIRQLHPNVWVMERGYVAFGIDFGAKMTIVRLDDNRLFIHSCLPLDSDSKSFIDSLGIVSAVVASNPEHLDFVSLWKYHYPNAVLLGPPGIQQTHPIFDAELTTDGQPHPAYDDASHSLRQVFVDGCDIMRETVFIHVPSHTLLVTDLIFTFPENIPLATAIGAWLLKYPFRSIMWTFFVNDKNKYIEALSCIEQYRFRTLVPTHGQIVTTDAVNTLKRWYWRT